MCAFSQNQLHLKRFGLSVFFGVFFPENTWHDRQHMGFEDQSWLGTWVKEFEEDYIIEFIIM